MKSMLFNTEMVKAILDGRKAVTRRIMKPQPVDSEYCNHEMVTFNGTVPGYYDADYTCACRKCGYGIGPSGESAFKPPYIPGDILYVRETWVKLWYVDPDGYTHFDQPMYYYAADGTPDITLVDGDGFELDDQRIRWHPSIHMPKEAARLFLLVKNVRVEKLQDIDDEGAIAEGVNFNNGKHIGVEEKMRRTAVARFAEIWDRTIKPADIGLYGWDANPYVWAISFERFP